jgi:hypothetical protein
VSNVPPGAGEDELRALFGAHGEVASLLAARGRARVAYFDARSAAAAAARLHGAPLRGHALEVAFGAPRPAPPPGALARAALGRGCASTGDLAAAAAAFSAAPGTPPAAGHTTTTADPGVIVVYNLDPDTTNDQLAWIFSRFGDVKSVRDAPGAPAQKHVEFYDTRHAAAALGAMNRAELAGGRGGCALGGGPLLPSGLGGAGGGARGGLGLARPASHTLLDALAEGSPTAGVGGGGQLSQSWDPAFNHEGLLAALGRAPFGDVRGGGGGGKPGGGARDSDGAPCAFGAAGTPRQALLQQQADAMQKLASAAQLLSGGAGGPAGALAPGGAPGAGLRPLGIHVSDSASSIASSQQGPALMHGPGGAAAGAAAAAAAVQHLQALNSYAAAAQQRHVAAGAAAAAAQEQEQQAAAAAAAAAAAVQQLTRGFGSSEQLAALGAAAAASGLGQAAMLSGSQSYGSLNLAAGGRGGGFALDAAAGGDLLRPGGAGLRSFSSPHLAATAAAAAAAAASQQQGGLLGGAGQGGAQAAAAAAAAAVLQAQAAAAAAQQHQQTGAGALQQQIAALQAGLGAGATPLQLQQLLQGLGPLGLYGLGGAGGGALAAAASAAAAAAAGAGAGGMTASASFPNLGGLPPAGVLPRGASTGSLATAGRGGGGRRRSSKDGGGSGGSGGAAAAAAAAAASPAGASADGGGSGGGAGSGAGARGSGGRLSRRAGDPAAEAERKRAQERLFSLDAERILAGDDKRTTLMIKNIPNKYTQKMLLQARWAGGERGGILYDGGRGRASSAPAARRPAPRSLSAPTQPLTHPPIPHPHPPPQKQTPQTIEESLKGTFDFFYLPIDFKNKCNVGYAFINMAAPADILPLVERFDGRRWERFNSEKVCAVSYARIQGRAALISHFQNSSLMHEDKRCRPVLFVTDGPHAGEQEPFPVGTNCRPRGAHHGSGGGGGRERGRERGGERGGSGNGGGGGGGAAAAP